MARRLARHLRVKKIAEFWTAGLARSEYCVARILVRLVELGFRQYEVDEVVLCARRAN